MESPEELVEIAKKNELEQIALTDHDTFGGIESFIESCRRNKLHGIVGIEIDFMLDSNFDFYSSEILGYFPKYEFRNTNLLVDKQLTNRTQIAAKVLDVFNIEYEPISKFSLTDIINSKISKPIDYDKVLTKNISLTKPDIYNFCVTNSPEFHHKFHDYYMFKEKFFNNNISTNLKCKASPQAIIESIRIDNGFPVLAHPSANVNFDLRLNKEEKEFYIELFKCYKNYGLWGVELHSCNGNNHFSEINSFFMDIINIVKLNYTYGSDHHEVDGNRDFLGQYYGEMDYISNYMEM